MIASHADVIALWKPQAALAKMLQVNKTCVTQWRLYNNIPYDFWLEIVESPEGKAAGLTVEIMLRTAKKRKHWKNRG